MVDALHTVEFIGLCKCKKLKQTASKGPPELIKYYTATDPNHE